jgi:hypothetical protein
MAKQLLAELAAHGSTHFERSVPLKYDSMMEFHALSSAAGVGGETQSASVMGRNFVHSLYVGCLLHPPPVVVSVRQQ